MPKAASGPNSISSLTCGLGSTALSGRLASSFMPTLSWTEAAPRPTIGLGNRIASGRDLADGVGQTVLLQHAGLPPEEQGRHRHRDEDLEEDPDVDACEHAVERNDVRMRAAQTHDLVDDGRGQE